MILQLLAPGLLMGGNSTTVVATLSGVISFDVKFIYVQDIIANFVSVHTIDPKFVYVQQRDTKFSRRTVR